MYKTSTGGHELSGHVRVCAYNILLCLGVGVANNLQNNNNHLLKP